MTSLIGCVLIGTGTATLSLSITYAYWTTLRVFFLRQRLFEVRDALFDAARSREAFGDPAYVAARRHLNVMIDLAGWYSLPVLKAAYEAAQRSEECRTGEPPRSADPAINTAINEAMESATDAVAVHVMRHRLSGCFFRFRYGAKSAARKAARVIARNWVFSMGPELLREIDRLRGRSMTPTF